MNLSNDYFKDALVKYVYLSLLYYFDFDTGEDKAKMVMKRNNSLYGLVQSPLYWYNNLKGKF